MGQVLNDLLADWSEGVNMALELDKLPINAAAFGDNSAFTQFGPGGTAIGARRGASIGNLTAVTGTTPIMGMFDYRKFSGGAESAFFLLVSRNGRLDTYDQSADTVAASDSGNATVFPTGDFWPDFAVANNLCFLADGQNNSIWTTPNAKFNGTAVQQWGIAAPTAAPTLATTTGGMTGSYDVAYSYYNTNTGHMSSRSASATLSVTAQGIQVTMTASSDPQVTHFIVHVRKPTIQNSFFVAATTTTNPYTINLTDAQLLALTVLSPDISENNPPPIGNYLAWHGSRMFLAGNPTNGSRLFYSKVGLPEAFDPDFFERINEDDGRKITALHSVNEILLIFKRDATYALFGDSPDSWQIRLLFAHVGCTSHRSLVTVEGITYWWSELGPMRWAGQGDPEPIGQIYLGDQVGPSSVTSARLHHVAVGWDQPRQSIFWAVPVGTGQTQNNRLYPWNYRVGRWEAHRWNPFDISAIAQIQDLNSRPWVWVGNYLGRAYKWWNADNDGARTGFTRAGSVTSANFSGGNTILTHAGATFDTTSIGLKELGLYLVDPNDPSHLVQRKRITANTATTITVESGFTVNAGRTYTYIVGGINFQWNTRTVDSGVPFYKKRYEFLHVQVESTVPVVTLAADVYFSYGVDYLSVLSLSTGGNAGVWGTSLWDNFVWGGAQATLDTRLRMARTGRAWKAVMRHLNVDEPFTLRKIAMRSELQRDKT